MEESAPKRRRTSPRTRVAVQATTPAPGQTNEPTTTRPSAQRTTRRSGTTPTSQTPAGITATDLAPPAEPSPSLSSPARRSRRAPPSFASPTKASLSRHNPEILGRRLSAQAQAQTARTPEARSPTRRAEPRSPDSETRLLNEQVAESIAASRQRETRSGSREATQPPSSATRLRVTGGLAAQPRRTPVKPSPRPLPPPAPEDEEEEEETRSVPTDGTRRVAFKTGVMPPRQGKDTRVPPEPEPEPELPPTTVERGLDDPIVTTPPTGIHSSSPSRRAMSRIKRKKPQSSPLKQPPIRPPERRVQEDRDNEAKGAAPDETSRDPDADELADAPVLFKPSVAREVQQHDPLAAKKKRKAALLAEVAELRADLKLATTENERLRQMHVARRRSSGIAKGPLPLGQADLVRLLKRHLLPLEREEEEPAHQWLDAAMNPVAWLPFAGVGSLAAAFSQDKEEELEDLPAPKSHHPVSMTGDEELPFLQVFTPMTFTRTTVMLPADPATGKQPLQRHDITVRSATPPGLFAAKIEMTVSPKHLHITSLKVPRLDPAAITELGPFIEEVLARPRSSAMIRNVSIISWAMGEWFRIALKRAHFWTALGAETGTEAKLLESVARVRVRASRRRPRDNHENEEGEADAVDAASDGRKGSDAGPVAGLFGQMGRRAMEIPMPDEESWLRVEWGIEFDWSGEARSKVAALVGIPGKWRRDDERGDLAKIPDIFEKLVHGEDPMTAVQSVVALLAGVQD